MKLSDFSYDLPEELIAKHPPKVRGSSRLLVLDRKTGEVSDSKYALLADFLNPDDVLVLNNTKVMKSRIITKNQNGAKRELMVLEKHGSDRNWHEHKVMYHGKLQAGEKLIIVGKADQVITVTKILGDGTAIIKSQMDILQLTEKYGVPPLPPYLKRDATPADIKRYQTVFARESGSAAAPTASLNMTEELLEKIRAKGVKIVFLTLHVGLGTFLPIRVDNIEEHKMHAEYFEIPSETIDAIREAKQNGNRVIAIGTTVARTLEYTAETNLFLMDRKLGRTDSSVSLEKRFVVIGGSICGEVDIFIYPGYKFKIIDALLTNFHAPKSTVLMLTAAFAGWDNLKHTYEHAKIKNYNFLSYGDSMLIK